MVDDGSIAHDRHWRENAGAVGVSRVATEEQHRKSSPRCHGKTSQALVDGNYATSARYLELRSYYDNELAGHGWTPCGERPLKDWFTDLGGMSRTYCKGELRAHLQYAG